MRIYAAFLAIALSITMTNIDMAYADSTSISIHSKSALSQCLAKARKKKGALARSKAIKACLARKRISVY